MFQMNLTPSGTVLLIRKWSSKTKRVWILNSMESRQQLAELIPEPDPLYPGMGITSLSFYPSLLKRKEEKKKWKKSLFIVAGFPLKAFTIFNSLSLWLMTKGNQE